jgi:hypothetical protein
VPGERSVSDAVLLTVPALAKVVAEPAVVAPDMSCLVEYLNALVVERSAGLTVADRVAVDVVTEVAAARVTTGATAVTVNVRRVEADA